MSAGVYWIYQVSQDRAVYVGSSKTLAERMRRHVNLLARNKHANLILQRTWNKYGGQDFRVEKLETCQVADLIEREEFWMNAVPSWPICNQSREGSATNHSAETRRKIGDANRGHAMGIEGRRRLSELRAGKPLSEAHRKAIGDAQRGKSKPGHAASDETRKRMSATRLGKKLGPASEAHRQANADAQRKAWARRKAGQELR